MGLHDFYGTLMHNSSETVEFRGPATLAIHYNNTANHTHNSVNCLVYQRCDATELVLSVH
jgi:hypothetical protein